MMWNVGADKTFIRDLSLATNTQNSGFFIVGGWVWFHKWVFISSDEKALAASSHEIGAIL